MITLLLFSLVPFDTTVEDNVDLIELNYYYAQEETEVRDKDEVIFAQLIYYNWVGGKLQIVDWRVYKPERIPHKSRGKWLSIFKDGGTLRKVSSLAFITTHTYYDRELADGGANLDYAHAMRRGLSERIPK